ncbi:MAG: class I SAM-dependent methyltransferase [Elusimicrobia bacterium]|nr:class I SAM-dependent methyltransferase [Elusimicrobiota bacterium]
MSDDGIRCVACRHAGAGSPAGTSREPIFGKVFELYECRHCGVVFSVLPADFPLQEWYGKAHHFYGETEWLEPGASPSWRFDRFLTTSLQLGIQGRLLDVGCGEGRFLREAKRRGWRGTLLGVEFNPEMAGRSEEGLRIEVCPFDEFAARAVAEEPFDAVVMFDVLEHMPEPARALAQVKRLLRAGGYLCVSVPNRERIRFFGFEDFDFPPNHITRWHQASLRALAEAAGFEVVALRSNLCTPASLAEQFFYPLFTAALPLAKRLLFGAQAGPDRTVSELLGAEAKAGVRPAGLKGAIADKRSRKKLELRLKSLFTVLTLPLTLPLCAAAILLRPHSGTGLLMLARLRAGSS